ncbi:glutamyl-tRNA reductase [Prochlorococcus marinus str. MIT 9515]|uniref:Glutamyl-tRNA reductase n=1 Tax=Prochlorococcus marinus (strain MIT 9515) TaxID=167542 RepID=HEM1_PROM5|nr:glutamyl-tRNA reductase [Prochlorococcus marinus]A2BW63.1 RecName: Full=Glutamyl-tRNA reductase; Short=GluTR [Prochlorococcus marinus str. MIT 9515]ABM72024.1 glutamyl-tRNA reductase [Prochlorococcus marinus str. MIT 9515]
MQIVVVGLSHRTAPVEVREKLSIPDQAISESLKSLRAYSDILEVSILSTCNRLEIYGLVKDKNIGISSIKEFLSDYSQVNCEVLTPHLFDFRQEEAVLHLMKVSAGLDSLVLGEGQILSQVKKMMRLGQENQSTGPILNRLLSQSVSAGKKVRAETNLGTGAVSISSAAVELAQLKIGQDNGIDGLVSLKGEKVLVVGAGRMSRLLITHLKSKGCNKLTLLNRNIDRAINLSGDFPDIEIICKGLDELDKSITLSSLVFTSTASEKPFIDLERIKNISLNNKLKFIDIGVPRNISNDVKQHDLIEAFDVDDLEEVVSRNQEFRQKIAKEAESLVKEERIIFLEWWASLEAVPVINKLRSDLELIRKEELQKALSRMGPDFSARERKVVEALTKGIINKILHTPVTKLRSPQSREERQASLKIVEKLFSLMDDEQK